MGRSRKFHYSQKTDSAQLVKAKARNVAVHYKNTVEAVRQIRGMTLKKAGSYLKNVLGRKVCVPFKRFKGGVGRCAQAKQFKTTKGRWPIKSVKVVQELLRNVAANCDYFGRDPNDFYILHIQVSQASVSSRTNYRAHGRVNHNLRHMCHLQVIVKDSNAA